MGIAGRAQSVERQALNLVVVGSSPTAGDVVFVVSTMFYIIYICF